MAEEIAGYGSNPQRPTWQDVDRLKKLTKMKLVLKGIETREDARLCREHGVDAIEVSNHGGRATEDLRATIDSLPEVIDGAGPRMKILIDGGIRRGADAFKALAMGASIRTGGCGARARHPAYRVAHHHAWMRHAYAWANHPRVH